MAHPLRVGERELAERLAAVPKDRFVAVGWSLLRPSLQSASAAHEDGSALAVLYDGVSNGSTPSTADTAAAWAQVEQLALDVAGARAVLAGWAPAPEGVSVKLDQYQLEVGDLEVLRAFVGLFTAEHEDRLLDVAQHLRNAGVTGEDIAEQLPG